MKLTTFYIHSSHAVVYRVSTWGCRISTVTAVSIPCLCLVVPCCCLGLTCPTVLYRGLPCLCRTHTVSLPCTTVFCRGLPGSILLKLALHRVVARVCRIYAVSLSCWCRRIPGSAVSMPGSNGMSNLSPADPGIPRQSPAPTRQRHGIYTAEHGRPRQQHGRPRIHGRPWQSPEILGELKN